MVSYLLPFTLALITSVVGAYFFCLIFGQEEGADEELASAPRMREIFQTSASANLNYMITDVTNCLKSLCVLRVYYEFRFIPFYQYLSHF